MYDHVSICKKKVCSRHNHAFYNLLGNTPISGLASGKIGQPTSIFLDLNIDRCRGGSTSMILPSAGWVDEPLVICQSNCVIVSARILTVDRRPDVHVGTPTGRFFFASSSTRAQAMWFVRDPGQSI